MITKTQLLIGCDWGTSSFRLRLLDLDTSQVLVSLESNEGIATTYSNWQKEGELQSQLTYFKNVLFRHVQLLEQQSKINLAGKYIVISGMASATIGMFEVPYLPIPFTFGLDRLPFKYFEENSTFPYPLLIISGFRTDCDVMRGEETQLLGLSELNLWTKTEETIVILPGTHSKHCHIKQNQLTTFQTFLTGELYQILASHSILSNSLASLSSSSLDIDERKAFVAGIEEAKANELMTSLFKVRTNTILNGVSKTSNSLYLSGLLIGHELRYLSIEKQLKKIIICGPNHLNKLYKIAMETIGLKEITEIIDSHSIENATIAGQIKFYENVNLANYA